MHSGIIGSPLRDPGRCNLDAALQLLANRAQYVTGASGVAIALRQDGTRDMLCRATAGTNAPELGALLSTEFGLSGETFRTKQALRCDDTARDDRVNREVCKQLGVASVLVLPVVNDDQVLGVFELFSEETNAFGEGDLFAVQRLSAMVQTAVQLVETAEPLAKPRKFKAAAAGVGDSAGTEGQFVADLVVNAGATDTQELAKTFERAVVQAQSGPSSKVERLPRPSLLTSSAPALPQKPLFWSAPMSSDSDVTGQPSNQSHVPPVLRDLRKCVACGFPISAGRLLCVECEEKKWRGQLRSQSRLSGVSVAGSGRQNASGVAAAPALAKVPAESTPAISALSSAAPSASLVTKDDVASARETKLSGDPKAVPVDSPGSRRIAPVSNEIFSPGIDGSQSWLAANKYIFIVLLVIAAIASAVILLR